MKTMRRILAMLLALVMVLSIVACNQEKPEETKNPGTNETKGPDKPKETDPVEEPVLGLLDPYPETVTISCSRTLDQISTYPEGVTNAKNGYVDLILEQLNIQTEVAFEAKSGEDYDRQVSLAIASGELPDMLYIRGNQNGSGLSFLYELIENDLILDLTDLYEQYAGEEMKYRYSTYGDAVLGMATVDGKLYALPYCAGMFYPKIWVRQDWIEALNLTVDTDGNGIITREELVMIAKAFKEADLKNTGKAVGLALPDTIENTAGMDTLTDSFGAYMLRYMKNEDGSVVHGSTQPEMKEALSWMKELYDEGVLDSQFGVRTSEEIKEMLINGELGIVTGTWAHMDNMQAVYEMDKNAKFVVYNLDNGNGKVNFPAPLSTKDQYLVISKECENPEAIFKILELVNFTWGYMTSEQRKEMNATLVDQLAAGMGGHARPIGMDIMAAQFAYDQQVKPALDYAETGHTDYPTFNPESNTYYKALMAWKEDPLNMDPTLWCRYHTRFQAVVHSHNLEEQGLYEMSYPIYALTETMKSNPVDLDGMMAEYFIKIITGELPVDAFDEYVTQRNSQGGADICDELAAIG